MGESTTKISLKSLLLDIGASFLAGVIVAFGLHIFSKQNNFVPGGITGFAYILASVFNADEGLLLTCLSIPLFVLVFIFIDKKLGLILSFYVIVQSGTITLLKNINFYQYSVVNGGELMFAALATGVVTGIGYALQIMRHGASGGTYAISALIKHWRPASNIAWVSFALDSSVVVFVFILNAFGETTEISKAISLSLCTLINLFIADVVVDKCLRGTKEGYKFEIITDEPESISTEIMQELQHGVTELNVHGMYTHLEKYMIVCIIRKRELSKMMRILKKYPKSFSSFAKVNEVFGKFNK